MGSEIGFVAETTSECERFLWRFETHFTLDCDGTCPLRWIFCGLMPIFMPTRFYVNVLAHSGRKIIGQVQEMMELSGINWRSGGSLAIMEATLKAGKTFRI